MADDPDPPRKFYQLKPREFEAVNEPPGALPSGPGEPAGRDPGPNESDDGRIDVRNLFKQANRPGPALVRKARAAAANDVNALLRDNLARANAAGLNAVDTRPKRASRRKRDYWLLLITIDLFFLSFVLFGGNVMTFAYGIAGFIIFTLRLTWIMWFVMDDY